MDTANNTLVKDSKTTVPSAASFLAGKPERIIMTDKPKVALTWIHTNENHAPAVAHEIYTKHPELAAHVNYICANPRTAATAPEKGFTGKDLNRCFGARALQNPQVYEEYRAVEVIKFTEAAEYIIDPHNTVCTNFGKVLIVDEAHLHAPRVQEILAASSVKRILVIGTSEGELTLVGEKKGRCVTIEYGVGTENEQVPDTVALIDSLITGKRMHQPFERQLFRMVGTIPKAEDPGLDVKNFEPFKSPDGTTHYAAFLGTGPRSYREDPTKEYCGFYATMERMVI